MGKRKNKNRRRGKRPENAQTKDAVSASVRGYLQAVESHTVEPIEQIYLLEKKATNALTARLTSHKESEAKELADDADFHLRTERSWPFPSFIICLDDRFITRRRSVAAFLPPNAEPRDKITCLGFVFQPDRVSALFRVGAEPRLVPIRSKQAWHKWPRSGWFFYALTATAALRRVCSRQVLPLFSLAGVRSTSAHNVEAREALRPLPLLYYETKEPTGYSVNAPPNLETKGTRAPLRYSYMRRSSESVKVRRGALPISAVDQAVLADLVKRGYRVYAEPTRTIREEDAARLELRGKRLKHQDEWLAILAWSRRATQVRPDLELIPSVRRVG